jgi:riboflavin synthase
MSWQGIAGLPPEKETELIEKLARRIVDAGFGTMAVMALQSIGPLSFAATQVGLVAGSPILMTLDMMGVKVYEYAGLFAESSRSKVNMERLITRIEELAKVAEEEEKREKEAGKGLQEGWLKKLRGFFA